MHRWLLFALLCLFLTTATARAEKAVGKAKGAETIAAASGATAVQATEKKEPFPLVESLFILMLAGFLGFEVIGRVSPLLHTPLMAATNAISGISLVGSLVIAGTMEFGDRVWSVSHFLGFLAVTAAMINVVGGFMITDRMLKMFRKKKGAGH
jgi:NAD(P) transhydrogenase subunit alpha